MTRHRVLREPSAPLPPGLGTRLHAARRRANVTQTELALAVGVSQAAIDRAERGICSHPRNIEKIADALNVPAWWLMYGCRDLDLEDDAFLFALDLEAAMQAGLHADALDLALQELSRKSP